MPAATAGVLAWLPRAAQPVALLALLTALSLLFSACAAPVGAVRADPRAVHQELTGNALTTGRPRTLSTIPVSPDVAVNSIVAVKGKGALDVGEDGVVRYESAHLDGVESELVVRWEHSVQGHPAAIEEVRRILLHHAGIR